jgi:hypothetical protein
MVREAGGGVSFRITRGSYGLITNIWKYDNEIWEHYTGWWMAFFPYIGNLIIPIDSYFFRGAETTNQYTSYHMRIYYMIMIPM